MSYRPRVLSPARPRCCRARGGVAHDRHEARARRLGKYAAIMIDPPWHIHVPLSPSLQCFYVPASRVGVPTCPTTTLLADGLS